MPAPMSSRWGTSRPRELSGRLVIPSKRGAKLGSATRLRRSCSIARAAKVSAVSPDWVTPMVSVWALSGGGE